MGNALFYHLTRSAAGDLLPALLPRARGAGWRVELRGTDPAAIEALDLALWQIEGFLPHGIAGGRHDSRQPVLLRAVAKEDAPEPAPNDPACLMALDGAPVSPAEAEALSRVCVIFDGNDPAALERARDQWRGLTEAGIAAEYWSEAGGKWERKR
ncbi:MAG: DNA polymerase III subunit chi [Paracoccus sp. (in: a-proteobacteria)]|nr:DNA polymerase III subunit chi [Paracoccus sp. (in: a-proteobacteria)]